MRADTVGTQAQQQVGAAIQDGQRGVAVAEAGIDQLASGIQIEVGMARQWRRRQRARANGEAQEQGSARHGEGS